LKCFVGVFKFMNSFENHAGFNISSSRLQVVEINFKSDQFNLENVDEAYFNENLDLEHDKETKINSLLQSAYNELLIRKPLKSNFVSFTLPLDLFHIMQVPYDNTLLNQDLIEEFRWEYSILYPYLPINELVIQYMEIDKNKLNETGSAIVIALPRKFLQIIHNFCSFNKLKIRFIDNAHIASDRALFVNNVLIDKGLVLSVYFSENNLSIIFSYDSKPVYFNIIQLNDAGQITSVLLDEINNNQYIKVNKNFIESAFIAGEDISISLAKSLSDTIGLNFKYFNPFEKIKPETNLHQNKCYVEKFNSFSPAAGIALRLA
jgi:Tfp pilus assembly PilM family ATPase